jgi:hypothetical protein
MLRLSCLVSVFVSLVASHAHAEPRAAPLTLQVNAASDDSEFEMWLKRPGSDDILGRCARSCTWSLTPGDYTLYAKDLTTGVVHDTSISLKRSVAYQLDPGNPSAAAVGLGLGVGGTLALLGGALAIVSATEGSGDSGCSSCGHSDPVLAVTGVGFLLAGAITAPIGFIMFGLNRRTLTTSWEEEAHWQRPALGLGLVGLPGAGAGLGAALRF